MGSNCTNGNECKSGLECDNRGGTSLKCSECCDYYYVYIVSVCMCSIVQDMETMLKNCVIFMSDGMIERNRAGLIDSVHSDLVHIYVRLHRHIIYCCNFIVNPLKQYVRCISLL